MLQLMLDDASNDKLYKFWDLRGTVDVNASVGEVPTLKFSLKGNADDPVTAAKQIADFGFQTTRCAPSILPTTIKTMQLALLNDTFTTTVGTYASGAYSANKVTLTFAANHGVNTGEIVAIQVSGATPSLANGTFVAQAASATTLVYYAKGLTGTGSLPGTVYAKKGATPVATFCFSTLTAANFFGFDYQRYLTGCDSGFAKGATPTDVSVTMMEDQVGGSSFDPDVNVTKFYGALLTFGNTTAGTNVSYMWDKLQLANVKQGKVASYLGRDVTFRNTGASFIIYS